MKEICPRCKSEKFRSNKNQIRCAKCGCFIRRITKESTKNKS